MTAHPTSIKRRRRGGVLLGAGDPPSARGPFTLPWPFRDSDVSRRQIGRELGAIEADFARSLAVSAWALVKPLRLLVFGLPMHAGLDDGIVAALRHLGHGIGGLDDAALAGCFESRWEFVAASDAAPSHYRRGPSYHDRLRLELLLDAWERASLLRGDARLLRPLAEALARATACFSASLALDRELLQRVAVERRADIEAEQRVRRGVRDLLEDIEGDDVRHLAIAGALDGWADLDRAVARFGTRAMRAWIAACRDSAAPTAARAELEPALAALRRELWAPYCAVNQ